MISLVKKHFAKLVAVLVLLLSSYGMIHCKQLEEVSSLPVYETCFRIFQTLFFSAVGYLIIAWLFKLAHRFRQLKNEKIEAELNLLKSKIDPHFFFNTLHNLYGLAITKSEKTPATILKLSDIMRYTIYEGENDSVSLEKEIDYLEKYIEIHQMRYQKNVVINFEKEIENVNVTIAPLLLIMILENGFKHGIESMTENAFMNISLQHAKDLLTFSVINNFEPQRKEQKGIGLKNLKKRLTLIYPQRHQLLTKMEGNLFTTELTLHLR